MTTEIPDKGRSCVSVGAIRDDVARADDSFRRNAKTAGFSKHRYGSFKIAVRAAKYQKRSIRLQYLEPLARRILEDGPAEALR
jgi:hypothetical protein